MSWLAGLVDALKVWGSEHKVGGAKPPVYFILHI
jgi:hypothetical protein